MTRPATVVVWTLALAALVTAAGCGNGGANTKVAVNQATPLDTARTMVEALKAGDSAAFVQCFCATEGSRPFLMAAFEPGARMLALRGAIAKSYGPDGLKRFHLAIAPRGSGPTFRMPEDMDPEKLQVTIVGDRAVCTMPDGGGLINDEPLSMLRVEGKWMIDIAGTLPPPGPHLDQAISEARRTTAPIERTLSMVGKQGETPESLAATFVAEMQAAMPEGRKDSSGQTGTPAQKETAMVVQAPPFQLTSAAFQTGQRMPVKYTGDGDEVSPPLAWSGAPEGTKAFALIMDDPDAPREEPWVHWLIYEIPPTTESLDEGLPKTDRLDKPAGALQGSNSWPKIGYRGPMPPKGHGVHHYHFKLYALAAALDLEPGLDKAALLRAIEGHVIGRAELVGTYER